MLWRMTDGPPAPEPGPPEAGVVPANVVDASKSITGRRLRPPPAAPPPAPIQGLGSTYKNVFLKGLATLLPTVVTLWVVVAVYNFINDKFAAPIAGVLQSQLIDSETGNKVAVSLFDLRPELARPVPADVPNHAERERERKAELKHEVERRFPSWVGFALAVLVVFIVGFFIASPMWRSMLSIAEAWLSHIPVVRSVYPSAKQMVEFILAGEESRKQWSAVVAVEYPRKGLWTIGYVTGKGLPEMEKSSGEPVRAVFLPASPTSMTGYVVIARLSEIVELDMTVDEALKFTISGGVVSPSGARPSASQRLKTPS